MSLLAKARLALIMKATLYPSIRPQLASCASVAPPPATTSALVTWVAPSGRKAVERSSLFSTIFAGLGAAAAAAPSPAKMVLKRLDLSTAFLPDGATHVTNADVVAGGGATDAQLASWGRIDGYKVAFMINANRALANKLIGPIYVVSSANTYNTVAGAHAAWLVQLSALKKTPGIHTTVGGRVGGESKLFTYT